MKSGEKMMIQEYSIYRVHKDRFEYGYNILNSAHTIIGQIYFGRDCDETKDDTRVWFRIENKVLYDTDLLRCVLTTLPNLLGLQFCHITSIDLAKDFKKSTTHLIDRLFRNKCITTIINGKVIKNRKQQIVGLNTNYGRCLDRLLNPTINLKQRKARHDKSQGLCIISYNKLVEIEESQKQYILDFYGNPKRLHRLEVHQNSSEIKDYCKVRDIEQSVDLIFDKDFLTDMYFYHLGAVLRFRDGRKKLAWSDLLGCTDRV